MKWGWHQRGDSQRPGPSDPLSAGAWFLTVPPPLLSREYGFRFAQSSEESQWIRSSSHRCVVTQKGLTYGYFGTFKSIRAAELRMNRVLLVHLRLIHWNQSAFPPFNHKIQNSQASRLYLSSSSFRIKFNLLHILDFSLIVKLRTSRHKKFSRVAMIPFIVTINYVSSTLNTLSHFNLHSNSRKYVSSHFVRARIKPGRPSVASSKPLSWK